MTGILSLIWDFFGRHPILMSCWVLGGSIIWRLCQNPHALDTWEDIELKVLKLARRVDSHELVEVVRQRFRRSPYAPGGLQLAVRLAARSLYKEDAICTTLAKYKAIRALGYTPNIRGDFKVIIRDSSSLNISDGSPSIYVKGRAAPSITVSERGTPHIRVYGKSLIHLTDSSNVLLHTFGASDSKVVCRQSSRLHIGAKQISRIKVESFDLSQLIVYTLDKSDVTIDIYGEIPPELHHDETTSIFTTFHPREVPPVEEPIIEDSSIGSPVDSIEAPEEAPIEIAPEKPKSALDMLLEDV